MALSPPPAVVVVVLVVASVEVVCGQTAMGVSASDSKLLRNMGTTTGPSS